MAFKGIIPVGSDVTVRFAAGVDNSGTAFLMVGLGPFTGKAIAKTAVIAPGATGSVGIAAGKAGILRAFVDVSDDDDAGQLTVQVGDQIKDDEQITGDTTWVYSVQ